MHALLSGGTVWLSHFEDVEIIGITATAKVLTITAPEYIAAPARTVRGATVKLKQQQTNEVKMIARKAIVLFSGGQDSTTCLAWALNQYEHVETIGFDYGQKHRIELDCRHAVLARIRDGFPQWASRLGDDHLLEIGVLGKISDTALTQDAEIVLQDGGLPNTFVPGRNLLFLTLAAALAYRRGCTVLVGGMSETDYSGYPDCRDNTMKAMQVALSLGIAWPLVIQTPLMWIDKAQTWQLAATLGGEKLLKVIQEDTHTCYRGNREQMHAWGFGCGACPACELRAAGFSNWRKGV